jgi:nucleotidyltransferase substrate binding protein (TIGR01987 family)
MARLQERVALAEKALATLEEVMTIMTPTAIERDAAIQRFEYTFEAVWKAAKQMLLDIEGIDAGSPKSVIRACREIGLFDDSTAVLALEMADDRNLTVHTYDEALAANIFNRLKQHVVLLREWVTEIEARST